MDLLKTPLTWSHSSYSFRCKHTFEGEWVVNDAYNFHCNHHQERLLQHPIPKIAIFKCKNLFLTLTPLLIVKVYVGTIFALLRDPSWLLMPPKLQQVKGVETPKLFLKRPYSHALEYVPYNKTWRRVFRYWDASKTRAGHGVKATKGNTEELYTDCAVINDVNVQNQTDAVWVDNRHRFAMTGAYFDKKGLQYQAKLPLVMV